MSNKAVKKAKADLISRKVKLIMDEGVRGKKVPVKQAVAIAHSYARRGKL